MFQGRDLSRWRKAGHKGWSPVTAAAAPKGRRQRQRRNTATTGPTQEEQMGSTREATTPPPTPAQHFDFYTYDPVQRGLHDDQKKRRGLNHGFGQLRSFHGCYVVSLAYAFRGYADNSITHCSSANVSAVAPSRACAHWKSISGAGPKDMSAGPAAIL